MSCGNGDSWSAFGGDMTEHASQGRACLPPGRRVYAVGDIHGRIDLLRRLNARILVDAEVAQADSCIVIYLGDYVWTAVASPHARAR